jgi:hypothetical protein
MVRIRQLEKIGRLFGVEFPDVVEISFEMFQIFR